MKAIGCIIIQRSQVIPRPILAESRDSRSTHCPERSPSQPSQKRLIGTYWNIVGTVRAIPSGTMKTSVHIVRTLAFVVVKILR